MRAVGVASVLAVASLLACSAADRTPRPRPQPLVEKPSPPGLRLPDHATPLEYELELDIDPDDVNFHGTVRIQTRIERATERVTLHSDQLVITSALWDGGTLKPLGASGDQMVAFGFGRIVAPRTVTLTFTFSGKLQSSDEGLFRQREGAWYVYSQGEAVFARRFVPCFDEPRFRTPWQISLVVPKPQVALSNMPEQTTTVLRNNKKRVVFAKTSPLPSYLVALAVGPFEVVDAGVVGRGKIPVRVAVRAGHGKRVGVVAARLPAIVDAAERYMDEPLPLTKLDLVSVPRFFGAMENPGLITFQEPILVGDPARTDFVNNFIFIAAHEIAHQWFGNLVTPSWWDHLWLSEAFASWLGDKLVRDLGAYDDAPLRFALARREAIEADRAPDAKPLLRHVQTTAEADEGFDSIAYAKGQLVLATVEAFLGKEPFRQLVRDYVRERRGTSVTSRDLIDVVGRGSTPQLADALAWLAGSRGTPVVELSLRCDAKATLVARAVEGPVPMCVQYATAGASKRTCALVGSTTELALGATCPTTVHANPDGAYYHVRWTSDPPRGPLPPLTALDPAARIILGDDHASAIHRGQLPAKDALAELRALAESRDPYAELAAIAMVRVLDPIIDDATRGAWESWLAARYASWLDGSRHGGRKAAGGAARPTAAELELGAAVAAALPAQRFATDITRRAYELVDKRLPHADDAPPATLVAQAAIVGREKLFERIAARARLMRDPESRESWYAVLGELDVAQVPAALELVTKVDVDPALAWFAIARYLQRGATRTAAWRAVRAELPTIMRRMGGEAASVLDATVHLCEQVHRDEVASAFAPYLATIRDGRARLARILATIDDCIMRRSKLGDVSAALAATP